jgi:hypothetical protein
MKTSVYFFVISGSLLLRTRNVTTRSYREIKIHIFLLNNFFFRKSCRLGENVEKYCTVGQATDDSMAHAPCMLDT